MAVHPPLGGAATDGVAAQPHPKATRWLVITGGAVLVLALVLVALALSARAPRSGPVTGGQPASDAPTASTRDVRWEQVGGVALPVSATHGPRIETHGRASGYSRSEKGAALAAAQVLMRTSATSGSDVFLPVIASQVTGANVAAFQATTLQQYEALRAQTAVASGAAIPGGDARILGYRIARYGDNAGAATVEVVVASTSRGAAAGLVSFAVSLQWSYDDWRVLAPPDGDWGSVATQLGTPPAGLLTYDEIG
jgi:hypothetical protein